MKKNKFLYIIIFVCCIVTLTAAKSEKTTLSLESLLKETDDLTIIITEHILYGEEITSENQRNYVYEENYGVVTGILSLNTENLDTYVNQMVFNDILELFSSIDLEPPVGSLKLPKQWGSFTHSSGVHSFEFSLCQKTDETELTHDLKELLNVKIASDGTARINDYRFSFPEKEVETLVKNIYEYVYLSPYAHYIFLAPVGNDKYEDYTYIPYSGEDKLLIHLQS